MMRETGRRAVLIMACVTAVAALSTSLIARPLGPRIDVAEGSFDNKNYFRLLEFIGKRQDKIIGLKIAIEKAEKDDNYLTAIEGQQLIIASLGRDPGIEALVSDGSFQHGSYMLDGFYLVKSGGVHQGTASYGLTNVDEAQVRLNKDLRIVTLKVGR